MRPAASVFRVVTLSLLVAACGGAEEQWYARGGTSKVAAISPAAEAQVVDAAVHAAFDVEPALNLRMHPLRLPRTAGDSGGEPVPAALVSALRAKGLVIGSCEPVRSAPKNTPHCSTPQAGYIIRPSNVFALPKDTLEVYLSAEKYGASTGQKPEALRFEKVYLVVKDGASYRVAREGRIRP